jgi:hypothetical protein
MGRHTSRVRDEFIGVALELVERIGTEAPTLREHGSHSSSTLSSPLHQIAGKDKIWRQPAWYPRSDVMVRAVGYQLRVNTRFIPQCVLRPPIDGPLSVERTSDLLSSNHEF